MRKAVEIEEIERRLDFITDINTAFHGNEKHRNALQKQLKEAMKFQKETVKKKADTNWTEKLARFQR